MTQPAPSAALPADVAAGSSAAGASAVAASGLRRMLTKSKVRSPSRPLGSIASQPRAPASRTLP